MAQTEKVTTHYSTSTPDDNRVCTDCDIDELLRNTAHRRPTFHFHEHHPQQHDHVLQIKSPVDQHIVVPIGMSLPRRDCAELTTVVAQKVLLYAVMAAIA